MAKEGSINNVLLNHFVIGTGAAGYLRGKIPELGYHLNDFFSTRSDIQRIQTAEKLAEMILSLTDFSEIIPLRSEVATLEIKRLLSYRKQTDHTAHTVYLFLLGIWVYDSIWEIQENIDRSIGSEKNLKMFIFQWTFASLLHDIGYLFYEYKQSSNDKFWEKFDLMFEEENIKHCAWEFYQIENFQEVLTEFKEFDSFEHTKASSALELVEKLDEIPWLEDLDLMYSSGIEVMDSNFKISNGLNEYTKKMATKGYDGETPVVDHGIASSLMLLKYTSMWYWLYEKSKKLKRESKDVITEFKYPKEVFKKHIIPACKAVAYHNVPNIKFEIREFPLLYLAILCDELQIWDRFLSGEEHVSNWKEIEHCMSEQIKAEVICSADGKRKIHFITTEKQHDKIIGTMEKRLNSWQNFIQISKYSS